MEFKIGDKVKLKDVNDCINRGRIDEGTAKRIQDDTFEVVHIREAYHPVTNKKEYNIYTLKNKEGFEIYCYDEDIIKCDETSHESIKNDRKDNKVMMELLPWPELEEIAKVYTAGARKYGPHNWENLTDGYERYKGAMLRHLTEVEKGNDIDQETGCLHAAQVAWNAIAMLHFKMKQMSLQNNVCNGKLNNQSKWEKVRKRIQDFASNLDNVQKIRQGIGSIESIKIEDEYWLFYRDGIPFKLNFKDMSVQQYEKGKYVTNDLSNSIQELIKGILII